MLKRGTWWCLKPGEGPAGVSTAPVARLCLLPQPGAAPHRGRAALCDVLSAERPAQVLRPWSWGVLNPAPPQSR